MPGPTSGPRSSDSGEPASGHPVRSYGPAALITASCLGASRQPTSATGNSQKRTAACVTSSPAPTPHSDLLVTAGREIKANEVPAGGDWAKLVTARALKTIFFRLERFLRRAAAKGKAMKEQHGAVSLLEDVHTSVEALGLRRTTTIGGIKCHVLLPTLHPEEWFLAEPSSVHDKQHKQDFNWPEPINWGDICIITNSRRARIRTVAITPIGTIIPHGAEGVAFDQTVKQWKQLLRDWLAVTAGGPTDSPLFYEGATLWESPKDDDEIFHETYLADHDHEPKPASSWAWTHAIGHASAADQPPLARALLTTAMRAAITANWRFAIIDAATAAEVALTTGLTARLSAEASPEVVEALIERTRMLGPRLGLARDLGMTLPAGIHTALLEHRNAVVHRGARVTGADAKAAIAAAWKVVNEYELLPVHCQEPVRQPDRSP
jgi:hypothetical protein